MVYRYIFIKLKICFFKFLICHDRLNKTGGNLFNIFVAINLLWELLRGRVSFSLIYAALRALK